MARYAAISTADPAVMENTIRLEHFAARGMGGTDAAARANVVDHDPPMTIAEIAREFGITLRALRFYEAKRLITPQRRGPTRLYRRSERERLSLVLTGRRLGFTLAEIGDLLNRPDAKALHLTREECLAQINLLEQQKRGIDIAIAELREIYTGFYRELLNDPDGRSR
jgi:DNA-binding transcriptional MerR regulator